MAKTENKNKTKKGGISFLILAFGKIL